MTRTSKKVLGLALGLWFVACGKAKPPLVPSVAFINPTDGATLTADAGTEASGILTITVTAGTTDVNDGISGNLTVDGADAGTKLVTNGTLTFPGVALTGGTSGTTHVLVVSVDGATAKATVTVTLGSTGLCAVRISPVDGTLFNETGFAVTGHNVVKDEDLTTAGMQAKISVTVGQPCQDGTTVTLTVGGNTLTATLASGVATFDAVALPDTPVTALEMVSQLLPIVATAAPGTVNESSDPINYLVDSQQPTIVITNPPDGSMLTQGSTVVVMGFTDIHQLSDKSVTVNIFNDGGIVTNAVLDSPGDGGFWATPYPPPLGNSTLTAQVIGVTGNEATSAPITFTVVPTGAICDGGDPTVVFTVPAAGASFNLSNDENGSPGFQTPIHITSSSMTGALELCSTVAPTATGAAACGFNAQLFHVGAATLSGGTAILDGTTLGDDGAAANQTLTAQVIDGICGMMGEGSITIQVHAIQPVIDSMVVENDFVSGSDAGCVWLNSANLMNGTAQTTILVTVDGSDTFADGGPTLTILGTTNQTDSAPFTTNGPPSAQVPISLPDGTYKVTASVTDIWGNTSAPDQLAICVKTTLPTCTIGDAYPNGCFNIQDNSGTALNGAVPVTLTISATNAEGTDINGNAIDGTASVTVNGGGGDGGPIASVLSIAVSSGQGADVYSATVTDPAGNPSAVCTPASLDLTVSTVAPTLTVTPTSSGNGTDDGGCTIYLTRDGISIGIATTDIASGASLTVQVNGAGGGSSAKTQATVTANSATATVSGVPNGIDSISVIGTDSCGNPGTGTPACIDVQATGCDLSLVSPVATATDAGESVVFNASQVTGGTAAITLHTSCPTGTQVQFDSTASGGSDQPQDGGVDANGDVTFDLTSLVDGSNGTFTSDISGGEQLPTISYDAKLSLPAFTGETPVAGDVEVVANQDNLILSDAGVTSLAVDGGTIIANQAQCTTTACADFTLSGISGLGPIDGNGNIGTATLTLNFGGGTTNPNPITIASGTTTVTFSAVSMPAEGSGTVTLTLTDNVGNTVSETWNVTTDGLQPPAPTLTAAMSDKRSASVLLSWTVPATSGAAATTSYELAYVINNLQATAPTTPSEATYATWTFDPGIASTTGLPGAKLTYTETGLPTLNQYTFELRAIDADGNRSPLTTAATAVSVSATDSNAWQTVTVSDESIDDAGVSDFGYVLRNGDFNGDGKQDLVITAPYQYAANPTPGIVYILNGAADLSKVTFASLSSITLGGTDFDWFGQDAHVADYNGDGIDDLAVGSPEYNNGQGRIDIFFGAKPGGLPANPSTTILGDSTASGLFGYSVGAVDVDGDGIQDLLVGAPEMGASNNGASYLFLGSKNNWPAPAAGADVSTATSVVTGNAGDGLGARFASVAIGDIDGDGDGDFILGAPGGGGTDGFDGGSGSVYGFSGATALANATMSVGSNALFTLAGRTNGYCDPTFYGYASGDGDLAFTSWTCFGVNAIGDVSFTGGKLPDLIVSSVYYSTADLYTMTKTGPTTPPVVAMSDSTGALGWSMVAPDLNGDGFPDLLVGENGGNPNVSLYLNTQDGGLPSTASGELFGASGSAFGYGLASGDFQGISKPDFAVSDWVSVDVTVYY